MVSGERGLRTSARPSGWESAIPRFHFNLRAPTGLSPDQEGADFATLEAAYLGAFRAVCDMWRELLIKRVDPRQHVFEITDAAGRAVLELPFTEVLETTGTARRPVPVSLPDEQIRDAEARETADRHPAARDPLLSAGIATQLQRARITMDDSRRLLARSRAVSSR